MDKVMAHGLVPFTNDPKFQEHYGAYLDKRESVLVDRLVNCPDKDQLRVIQGQVQELRKLRGINREVLDFIQTQKK